MKISNREKIMLYILGIIIIGYGYYNFVYSYQQASIEKRIKAESDIEKKYTSAIATIDSLENKKSEVKVLNAKIKDQSSSFYPVISQKHLVLELDKLLKDSGLKGGITFKPIVSDGVEASKKEQISLPESSFQEFVDKYNNITSKEENPKSSNEDSNKESNKISSTSNDNNGGSVSANNSNADASKGKDDKEKKNTVQYLKCEIKFEGTYESLDKFLEKVGENERKLVVNSIKITQDTLNELKGTIELEIYSLPKIADDAESYLRWDFNNNIYGKNVPFSNGAATGVSVSNKNKSDFMAAIKSVNSDLPSIMLGKTEDTLRRTYVYDDNNSEENVEMTLSEEGNKYYYKYKTSKVSFPINYDELGEEFIPEGDNIVINILSSTRDGTNDKSKLILKLINKTDKLVEVNISDDDPTSPRVKVDGDGDNISVNQK